MHNFSIIYGLSLIFVYALVCHYDTIIAIFNTFHSPPFCDTSPSLLPTNWLLWFYPIARMTLIVIKSRQPSRSLPLKLRPKQFTDCN